MATKTFDHAVIYNGNFYPANTPIKVKEEVKPTEKKATAKKVVLENAKGTSRKS